MNRCFAALLLALGLLGFAAPAADEPKALEPIDLPINTASDEDDPHVSSNNLTLFYVSNASKKLEIMTSTRQTAKDPWPSGQLFPFLKSKDADFRSPFLTADGKYPQRFYYSSNMDPQVKGTPKGDNYDVYYLVKFDAKADFGPFNALITIGTELDELHPWLTPDERLVYFSRKTEGGWRQFVASKPPDGGQFGIPVQVRLPLGFHHATLTPDGKTMYLQGPVASAGKGQRWGLFVSKSTGKDAWSKPEALVGLNNPTSPRGDLSPALSRDGTMLYFASDRPGGKGGLDVWMIPTAQLPKTQ